MEQSKIPTKSSGELPEETVMEKIKDQVEILSEQNNQLLMEKYVSSLSDEKVYRLEMLKALEKISMSLEKITQVISEGLYQESEEEKQVVEPLEETEKKDGGDNNDN